MPFVNMPSEQPKPNKSEKHPLDRLGTPVAELFAMPDEVMDEVADEETDTRSTKAHPAKWTIIPLKHGAREMY
jgi:hypothetical protein